jgi:hypothetical protein
LFSSQGTGRLAGVMKTYVTYGFFLALALMLLNLVLFFLGFHSDADKYATADLISKISFWVFAFVFIWLGTRVRRSETPVTENFGYGSALLTGFMISVFAALFSIVTNYLYVHVINPGFMDIVLQAVTAKAEAKGASAAQIEQMEKGFRMMTNPIFSSIFIVIIMVVCGTIVSLITSIFIRRPAVDDLAPPVSA